MPIHHRRHLQRFNLLLTLCCTILLLPSIGITSHTLDQNSLLESAPILLSPQTDEPSWSATPPQKAYDLLRLLEKRGGQPLPGYVGGNDAFPPVAIESMMSIRRSAAADVMPNGS